MKVDLGAPIFPDPAWLEYCSKDFGGEKPSPSRSLHTPKPCGLVRVVRVPSGSWETIRASYALPCSCPAPASAPLLVAMALTSTGHSRIRLYIYFFLCDLCNLCNGALVVSRVLQHDTLPRDSPATRLHDNMRLVQQKSTAWVQLQTGFDSQGNNDKGSGHNNFS